jgi:dephospho-CoA kinase
VKTSQFKDSRPSTRTQRVVLTGGIATGKSYALDQFATLGAQTLDADQLAHAAVAPGGAAWNSVREHFGATFFDKHGVLDRRKLGALVFADTTSLAALNVIIHPHVRSAITSWFAVLGESPRPRLGIVAIPLFFENQHTESVDRVIVTACRHETQLARVIARGFTEDAARQRIAVQLPTIEKVRQGDFTIWTDSTYADTDRQVGALYSALSAETLPDRD